MEFPTLFKKDNDKIRLWRIYVKKINDEKAEIYTEYGLTDGKITKPAPKIVSKSIGIKTAFDRAVVLAKTKWENHKIIQKYKENVENTNTNTTHVFQPMKPSNYEKSSHYIKFPAYLQPKLDGFRLFTYMEKNNLEMVSRQSKPIEHLQQIKKEIEYILKKHPNYVFDGELIGQSLTLHNLKSILSRKTLNKNDEKLLEKISYNIFDLIDMNNINLTFHQRLIILKNLVKDCKYVRMTPTYVVQNKKEINTYFTKFINEGHEGAIIRNFDGKYKMKSTSKDVQKIKLYFQDTFEIIDFDESSGDNKGTVIWVVKCLKNKNRTFRVKPKGTREQKREWFNKGKSYIGKKLTVYFFEKDDDGCVVRLKTGEMK